MLRNVDLSEISDNRLYNLEDMAKVGCNDCKGCSSCCKDSADTIVLDPRDVFELMGATGKNFSELMERHIELGYVDDVLLPHLHLYEDCGCSFLNEEGRCSIHKRRPINCRMFPLGRIFENGGHSYFLQKYECEKASYDVKVKDWLGIENICEYEKYTDDWHYFLRNIQEIVKNSENKADHDNMCKVILNFFYIKEYDVQSDFYMQFYERLDYVKRGLGI